jgi:aldose 1-epimerase
MACVSELGAALVRLDAPDRYGQLANVTLGLGSAEAYLADRNYLGSIVGRYAGRIAAGRFVIDGRPYQAPCNEGGNLLHGGAQGFHQRLWRASIDGSTLRLDLISPDGEGGFPGEVRVTARYAFSDNFALRLDLAAQTSAPTPFNLTHHGYWNLAGAGALSVLDHELSIAAALYQPVGPGMIPAGATEPVAGTPFDFRSPKQIGRDLEAAHPQLASAGGFDHSFVTEGAGLRRAATLEHQASGRSMTIDTDVSRLHLYTFNAPQTQISGRDAAFCRAHSAVALEPQGLSSKHTPTGFPLTVLRPDEAFQARVVYKFKDASTQP